MFRVTADSNIYISALHFGGPPRRLIEAARAGLVQLAISEPLLEEAQRILRTKFARPQDRIADVLPRLLRFAHHVEPTIRLNVIERDPSDNRVLECAHAAGSRFIVTGDDDLLTLAEYEGIRILKVADFLAFAQLP